MSFAMFQSMVEGRAVPWDLLVKDVPPEHHHDLDYIVGMLDWEANVDPEFASTVCSTRSRSRRRTKWRTRATRRSGSSIRRVIIQRKS